MDFEIQYDGKKRYAEMEDILLHLRDLGVKQAMNPSETGIHLMLVSMSTGEKHSFDNERYEEITVVRIS